MGFDRTFDAVGVGSTPVGFLADLGEGDFDVVRIGGYAQRSHHNQNDDECKDLFHALYLFLQNFCFPGEPDLDSMIAPFDSKINSCTHNLQVSPPYTIQIFRGST